MSEMWDLSKIPLLIDMGKPLVKFAKIHNPNYYFCHRHILENIGDISVILRVFKLLITLDSELIMSEIFMKSLKNGLRVQNEANKDIGQT